MPKYEVYGTLEVGVFVEVEANSFEEAKQIALAEYDLPSVCGQCSRGRKSLSSFGESVD